jgi:hypothetical protein
MSAQDGILPALTGTLPLPIWAVGAAVALIVVVMVFAVMRTGPLRMLGIVVRYALVLIGVLFIWAYLERAAVHERAAERRALDARAAELTARALAPGSALACIDGIAGETVSASCEKAVFASPEAVAAGLAYVTAQLSLLADGIDFTNRSEAAYESSLAMLQGAIELDRFGFVAYVLAVRDGCTSEKCESFVMLRDPSRVRANLKVQTFQRFVGRNAVAWSGQAGSPTETGQFDPPTQSAPVAGLRPQGVPTTIDFPSAASIPPVSIMNAEPPLPAGRAPAPPNPPATPPPAASTPPPPPPPPTAAAGEPSANAPSPRRPPPPVRKPAPAQPQQGTAPPVQLTPQPPEANAGAQTRAQ